MPKDLLSTLSDAGLQDDHALYLALQWPNEDPAQFLDGQLLLLSQQPERCL